MLTWGNGFWVTEKAVAGITSIDIGDRQPVYASAVNRGGWLSAARRPEVAVKSGIRFQVGSTSGAEGSVSSDLRRSHRIGFNGTAAAVWQPLVSVTVVCISAVGINGYIGAYRTVRPNIAGET